MASITVEELGLDQEDIQLVDVDSLDGVDAAAALRKQQAQAAARPPRQPKPKPK